MTPAQLTTPRRAPLLGLVASYFVSETGTAMAAVAIPRLVLGTTGSAGRTGLAGFAELMPYVAIQATAGPLADRYGWRRTCVAGNVAAGIALGAVTLLSRMDELNFGTLVAAVAIAGAARGAADAATAPLVPGTAALGGFSNERAAGLYSGANRTGLLIGMPLAGVLVVATSPATVVLLDAITFWVAALGFASTIPASVQDAVRADTPAALGPRAYAIQLVEGFRFLGANRLLLGLATLAATSNFLDQALMSVLLPVWSRTELHRATGVGAVGGVFGVGALAGVLVGAWLGERLPRYPTFAIGYLVGGAPPFLALAFSTTLPPVVVVVAVAAFFGGFLNPIIGAVCYELVPPNLRARVLGAVRASAWLGLPLGALAGGLLGELAGLRGALVITGVAMLVATLAPSVFPSWRRMDRTLR